MIDEASTRAAIEEGRTALGIELGSTRIKAVLIDEDHAPIATGGHDWENQFVDRMWTYSLESVRTGLQAAYASLAEDVRSRYGVELRTVGSLGVSAMMHGYLPFDASGELLVPFRTWRNTVTGPASEQLTGLFGYAIPQRWSVAHLYQAVLNGEEHVGRVAHLTTLAGYVHEQLTGRTVLGVGDASGMFPIDTATGTYHAAMLGQFDDLVRDRGYGWTLGEILPPVLSAGEPAGQLTARWLRQQPAAEVVARRFASASSRASSSSGSQIITLATSSACQVVWPAGDTTVRWPPPASPQ